MFFFNYLHNLEFYRCDEVTQRLLSLEFGQKEEELKLAKHDAMKKVQRHQYDFHSPEANSKNLYFYLILELLN